MSSQIQVRKFDLLSDQHLGRNVFDQTWAMDSGTEITPNLLQAMVHSGSYLSGAFMDGNVSEQPLHSLQLLVDYTFTHI